MTLPASEGRKPTVEEAADWLRKSLTLEYQLACIRYWRTLYGDEFANQVEMYVDAGANGKKPTRR